MEITQQELFDALTAYYKNDWRKTGRPRFRGIQVGNSKWYLICDRKNRHMFVYKHDDNYDLSDFGFHIQIGEGRETQWWVGWRFLIGDINTVVKRKAFSDGFCLILNDHAEGLEEKSLATEVA